MLSDERKAEMVMRYQSRLELNKKWAKYYYDNHRVEINQKRLLSNILKGHCPKVATVEKLAVDRTALINAWNSFVERKSELSEQAKEFHKYVTGSNWSPVVTN